MSDDRDGRAWIVGPSPGSGEIAFQLAVGEGVELDAAQQAALGELLRALEDADAEVVGLGSCDAKTTGCELTCGQVICKELVCWKLNKASVSATAGWSIGGTFGLYQ